MASSLLGALDVHLPLVAAPMAGGPSTADLVIAAGRAGSMGFLAGGYKTPEAVAAEVAAVEAAGEPFGVNLFVPNPDPVDREDYRHYVEVMRVEARRFGIELPDAPPVEDDDGWLDKVEVLVRRPVPAVSFTFGLPSSEVVSVLRRSGALLIQTVTSVREAAAAVAIGVDALAVQGAAAGGHYGTFTPRSDSRAVPLLELVRAVVASTKLPVIAAGGVGTAADVTALIGAGADAVAVGTALLRAGEAGTNATHRAALADPGRTTTVVTHAFTGRPARALRNDFTDRYSGAAPFGYPALHHLTSPMRKAAAAAGDAERLHLWAGTGHRHATDQPVAVILDRLAQRL